MAVPVLRRIPAILSAIVLAAHFLRFGQLVPVALCLAAIVLFFVRATWAVRASRLLLLAGSGFWIVTATRFVRMRQAAGAPWIRLAVILGAVAVVAALAAWLLPGPPRPVPAGARGDRRTE